MTATTIDAAPSRTGRYIYVWMAAACAAVAFGGFAGTYWLQLPAGTFIGHPIVHVHALVFSAWLVLLLSQTWLAANGRLQHHRAWGVAGVSLATAMIFVGMAAMLDSLKFELAEGYGLKAREFMVLPFSALLLFGALFAAAVINVKRPEWHKRLMLVATVGIIQAAMARVFFLLINGGGPGARPGLGPPLPVAISIAPGAVVDLIILAGIVYDWRTRGRPHPAYLWAGGATVVVQLIRVPLSHSAVWLACAGFLERFAA
jgi:hypothetical protein